MVLLSDVELEVASINELGVVMSMVEAFHIEGHLPWDDVVKRAVEDLVANRELGAVLLVKRAGVVCGYFALTRVHSLEFGGRCLLVDEVFLVPEARGQGLGTTAFTLLMPWSEKVEGARTLFLEVESGNIAARRLYDRFGFQGRPYELLSRRA